MRPQNFGLQSSCKTYINESLFKYFKSCDGKGSCYRLVAVFNRFGWQMGQYESGIKTMG